MKNQKKIENFASKVLTGKEMATIRGGDGGLLGIKPTPPQR